VVFETGKRLSGPLKYPTADMGRFIRETRKKLLLTQKTLALTSGTGLRFIIELGKGKETASQGCHGSPDTWHEDDAHAAAQGTGDRPDG
jgi:hypothetical protein